MKQYGYKTLFYYLCRFTPKLLININISSFKDKLLTQNIMLLIFEYVPFIINKLELLGVNIGDIIIKLKIYHDIKKYLLLHNIYYNKIQKYYNTTSYVNVENMFIHNSEYLDALIYPVNMYYKIFM